MIKEVMYNYLSPFQLCKRNLQYFKMEKSGFEISFSLKTRSYSVCTKI